ncbi:MAG: AAA family ATPase [Dehalococcoidia bacterium]|nr:AAA family ATPase [Dehalococcoidia bacterium]
MIALCVASPQGQVGKTAICCGIARKLQNDGKKVGYFKPVSIRLAGRPDRSAYKDCDFANEVLGLARPAEVLCPVVIGEKELQSATRGVAEMVKKIEDAYREASRDHDVMIIEGPAGLGKGSPGAVLLGAILAAIPAKLVVLLQYSETPMKADIDAIDAPLKGKMIGVVVNGVPVNRLALKTQIASGLNTTVFGIVPQDRTLMGVSVREIVEALGAEEVTPGDGVAELVENVMVGASVLDHGPMYFNRKSNKAVLIRGERPDMQLAALETPTKALVLTGGVKPIDQVLKQARRRKVPVVVASQDTQIALSKVSEAVAATSFAHRQKLNKLDEILAQNFDFKALYKAAGI